MNQTVATPQDRSPTCSHSRARRRRNVLGLDQSAASKRYARALERLKEVLTAMPGESREG
jgi:hypothetical protein